MKNYLQKKNNNRELSLFDAFDDFFRPVFYDDANDLRTDIKETDKEYALDIEVPGYNKEQIKIALENGYLTVSCEKKENTEEGNENSARWLRKEISESCSRSYYVGDEVQREQIKAKYENGILRLTVPKVQPKRIDTNYIDIE